MILLFFCTYYFSNMVLCFFLQDKFLPFVDMFQKETIKVDVCKLIMQAFIK